MALQTETLVTDTWTELTNPDTHPLVVLEIQGTGTVVAHPSAVAPDAGADGFLLFEGIQQITIADNKSLWVKLTSGSADVLWSDTLVSLTATDISSGTPTVSLPSVSIPEPP